jgi:peroxiredoxin
MPTTSSTVEIGSPAPDFELPSTAGETVSLTDFAGRPALLVAFICNHCPYVRHVESELARVAADYAGQGLATVAISANDITTHPEDAPEQMAQQRTRAGFAFPYLYDESQDVARAYGAVCTPDLFLYDAERRLAYRGEFDGSRPQSGVPVTGESLRKAIEHVLAGEEVPGPHRPSVGCSIKWREAG